ncbi:YfcL family protein [Pseudidiomarina sp. E22-M8]|uniref:YfcL family protein n=1 Tax=Pseudidiomarina sp. E22-M8 TaxID=3424768 RepID=UPI00403CD6C6
MQQNSFDQFIQQLEQVFDQAVQDGDDDELFASGYLRGHFDLVVAQLELQEKAEVEVVLPSLKAALDETKHELSPADQQHIAAMVAKLEAVAD